MPQDLALILCGHLHHLPLPHWAASTPASLLLSNAPAVYLHGVLDPLTSARLILTTLVSAQKFPLLTTSKVLSTHF
jgi:hypothetical protein